MNYRIGKNIFKLGKIQEIYGNQARINNEWYAFRILDEMEEQEKLSKLTVAKVREVLSKVNNTYKETKLLKNIYEKMLSRNNIEYLPNLYVNAPTGGHLPKDLYLQHNIKEKLGME